VAAEPARHGIGVFGFNPQIIIGQRGVVDGVHDGGGHVLQAFQSMESGGGLGGNAFDAGDVALEAAGGAGEGSAGSHAGDEVRDATVGLFDDFGAGAFEMGAPVGGVAVLIGVEILFGA